MNIFKPADILLPKDAELSKWSVVACDQFSSQPEYWEKAKEIVGDAPSALNLVLPEAYLDDDDAGDRISKINETMRDYLRMSMFRHLVNSFIYVERTQSNGKMRRGLIGALDLEAYDFSKGSVSPVRATEGTILSRIPPRRKIRRDAPLELPHIIMLVDDPKKTVIEPLSDKKSKLEKLYDFDLMLGGGHIMGYLCDKADEIRISDALDALADKNVFREKYGKDDVILFAAGDGNHSLATAKSCWEELKKTLSPERAERHPARYALVELENIHDDGLDFEPIQRVIFGVDPKDVLSGLVKKYNVSLDASFGDNGDQCIRYVFGGTEGAVYVSDPPSNLPVGTLQLYLDEYLKENGGSIDYIHGDDMVRKLAQKPGTIGFMLPPMQKSQLFETVIKDGALPRKTFSMGEAQDKRYYLEAREIKIL